MKLLTSIFALVSLVLFTAFDARATSPEEKFRIEEQKRKKLESSEQRILAAESRFAVEWGGWIDNRYDDYKNDDNNRSLIDALDATRSFDFRLWVKATFKPRVGDTHPNEHSVYVRFKNIYTITTPDDLNKKYDNEGPDLDQGYAVLDMRPWWLEFGRRYYMMGQGIAYGNVHDGLELSANFTDWNLKAFFTHTLPDEANVDLSVPGATRGSDRSFHGFEARYIGLPGGHSIYGFYVLQRDSSDEDPVDVSADYTYDSEYLGLGLQGKLLTNSHYWVELVYQTGRSHVFATGAKQDVNAWAGDIGVTLDVDVFSHPNLSFEYAFGSGDGDRINVTDTRNGNSSGRDKNYLYFGYLPTGYALSPRLSNLHMYKASVLLTPLQQYPSLADLTLGIDYYRFYKDKKRGGISDTQATLADPYIGSEIDLTLSWQVLSDVTITFEYGYFKPGDAYPSSADDSERYFSVDATFTF